MASSRSSAEGIPSTWVTRAAIGTADLDAATFAGVDLQELATNTNTAESRIGMASERIGTETISAPHWLRCDRTAWVKSERILPPDPRTNGP